MANRFPLIVDVANTQIKEIPAGDALDFTGGAVANLAVANLQVTGGSNGQFLRTDGTGNLTWGSISTSSIANGTSNVNIPVANGNVNTSVGGVANVFVVTSTGANVAGTLNVTGDTVVGGNLTVDGNITYVNVDSLQVEDPLIELGGGPNGAALTSNDGKDRGAVLHYYTSAPVDAFMGWDNSNAEFAFGSNVSVANDVVTFNSLGNVRAQTFIGNGALNTLTVSGTSNLGAVGNVKISGGFVGAYLTTDGGSQLSWVAPAIANSIANGISSVSIPALGGNVNTSVGGTANVLVVTSNGANVTGTMTATGNVSGGNLITTGLTSTGNLTVTGVSNLGAVGNVTITGGSNEQMLTTDGTGNLSWTTSWRIANGLSNVSIPTASGNVLAYVAGTQAMILTQGRMALGFDSGTTNQGIAATSFGYRAGRTNQGARAVAIGPAAGSENQGEKSIAIGIEAGNASQGANSIAIGPYAGSNNQPNNTIILNATGVALDAVTANATYIAPIRNAVTANVLYYNPSTNEITYSVATGGTPNAIVNGNTSVAINSANGVVEFKYADIRYGNIGNTSVALGANAGLTAQGSNAIAIGTGAGTNAQPNNTTILNATGANLEATVANALYIAPIRNDVANITQSLYYNSTTKEVTWAAPVLPIDYTIQLPYVSWGFGRAMAYGPGIYRAGNSGSDRIYGYGITDTGVTTQMPINTTGTPPPPTSWVKTAALQRNWYGLGSDGVLWTMGFGGYGGLGNNSTATNRPNIAHASHSSLYGPGITVLDFWVTENNGSTNDNDAATSCFVHVNDNGVLKTYGFGWNFSQVIGGSATNPMVTPFQLVPLNGKSIVSACVSWGTAHFVTSTGELWACGFNTAGALGIGNTTVPTVVTQCQQTGSVLLTGAAKVVVAWQQGVGVSTMVLKTDGTVWATGFNTGGRLGVGDTTQRTVFTQVLTAAATPLTGITHIWANFSTFIMLNATTGDVYFTGQNMNGMWGNGQGVNTAGNNYAAIKQTNVEMLWSSNTLFSSCMVWYMEKPDGLGRRKLWAAGFNANLSLGILTSGATEVATKEAVPLPGYAAGEYPLHIQQIGVLTVLNGTGLGAQMVTNHNRLYIAGTANFPALVPGYPTTANLRWFTPVNDFRVQ